MTKQRGVTVPEVRRLVTSLENVSEGRMYGTPAFLLNGHFFGRFRDNDTVFVLHVGSIDNRDVLVEMDPNVFFFTDHYRNYPAVLIRLAEVPRPLLTDIVKQSWRSVARLPPAKKRTRKSR